MYFFHRFDWLCFALLKDMLWFCLVALDLATLKVAHLPLLQAFNPVTIGLKL
jgi:hypothetical protein